MVNVNRQLHRICNPTGDKSPGTSARDYQDEVNLWMCLTIRDYLNCVANGDGKTCPLWMAPSPGLGSRTLYKKVD